jgi:hypothetical protein
MKDTNMIIDASQIDVLEENASGATSVEGVVQGEKQ